LFVFNILLIKKRHEKQVFKIRFYRYKSYCSCIYSVYFGGTQHSLFVISSAFRKLSQRYSHSCTSTAYAAIQRDCGCSYNRSQFPYRSPVDRDFLANLLTTIENKGAKAVGIDILFDQGTEEKKDQKLKKTLQDMQIPTFVSYTTSKNIVNDEQLQYLNTFILPEQRAAANLSSDPFDGSVRWIFPGETELNMPMGFARKAAAIFNIETPNTALEIAWRSKPNNDIPAFPVYPAHLVKLLPDEWFKDKLVLIGAVLSITDRHRTPLAVVHDNDDGMMPGILIQAHSAAQLIEKRQSPRPSTPTIWVMTLLLSAIGVCIGLLKKGVLFNLSAGIVFIVTLWLGAMLGFMYGMPMVPLIAPTIALALSLWMMDILVGSTERKQREFVQGAFSRYVSPAVVGQLIENPEALRIQGERKELTFVFTDVAGFTTLSEKLSSEKLSEVLNAYLDGACEIILRHEGTIDKFIGDAIMSIFNAPIAQIDHHSRAVRCALELDAYAEAFRQTQNEVGIPMGTTRIGLHTGPAVIGNFGSRSRMDFTALGDTVNTAARCEGVNKYFGTRICCTEAIVANCSDIHFMPIGDIVLKGKLTPVKLYSPVDRIKAKSDLYVRYISAYHLLEKKVPEAKFAFVDLYADYPGEPLIKYHYERILQGVTSHLVMMDDK
jgi:adenylate cyclase